MSSEDVEEARQLLLRYAGSERAMPTCDEMRQFLKAVRNTSNRAVVLGRWGGVQLLIGIIRLLQSREARIRNPEDVANYGSLALRAYKGQLAEEEREYC